MPPRSRWGAPPLRGGPNTTPVDADLVIFTPAPGAPARRAPSARTPCAWNVWGERCRPARGEREGGRRPDMTADSLRTTTSVRRGRGGRAGGLDRLLPLAGAVYVLSWLLGLSLGPSAPGPRAPAVDIQAYYVGHTGGIVVQSLLVHGLAGIALAVLALGFARALSAEGPSARWVRGTGLVAALVSLLQVVLALIACSVAATAPRRRAPRCSRRSTTPTPPSCCCSRPSPRRSPTRGRGPASSRAGCACWATSWCPCWCSADSPSSSTAGSCTCCWRSPSSCSSSGRPRRVG